ncbi:hypothetical protein BKA65DRAFT_547547 [Rhexocercosporidium sp. MPI-PUGE-AT-0058]|nr:hypothetical protein BKA65DRAFT_547547 [Rhexocercosporidium sp. MPI-PUGE-AT-0058]
MNSSGCRNARNKRKRESSEESDMVAGAPLPRMMVYSHDAESDSDLDYRSRFSLSPTPPPPRPLIKLVMPPIWVGNEPKQPASVPEDLICDLCKMTFDNKDLRLAHLLRTPHGFNENMQIVPVPAGYGLDDASKIVPVPPGYRLDNALKLVAIPQPSVPQLRGAPTALDFVVPPPFMEPGCPATGAFVQVGTPGTPNPPKAQTWHCPWVGCDKKNWKIYRLNRHINTTHVAVKRSYSICGCGQAYATKAEEEAHRAETGHPKAV